MFSCTKRASRRGPSNSLCHAFLASCSDRMRATIAVFAQNVYLEVCLTGLPNRDTSQHANARSSELCFTMCSLYMYTLAMGLFVGCLFVFFLKIGCWMGYTRALQVKPLLMAWRCCTKQLKFPTYRPKYSGTARCGPDHFSFFSESQLRWGIELIR